MALDDKHELSQEELERRRLEVATTVSDWVAPWSSIASVPEGGDLARVDALERAAHALDPAPAMTRCREALSETERWFWGQCALRAGRSDEAARDAPGALADLEPPEDEWLARALSPRLDALEGAMKEVQRSAMAAGALARTAEERAQATMGMAERSALQEASARVATELHEAAVALQSAMESLDRGLSESIHREWGARAGKLDRARQERVLADVRARADRVLADRAAARASSAPRAPAEPAAKAKTGALKRGGWSLIEIVLLGGAVGVVGYRLYQSATASKRDARAVATKTSASAPSSIAPDRRRPHVTIKPTDVFAGPGVEFTVIEAIATESTFAVVDRSVPKWIKVRLASGKDGWVQQSALVVPTRR